jgi:hypothetical protein
VDPEKPENGGWVGPHERRIENGWTLRNWRIEVGWEDWRLWWRSEVFRLTDLLEEEWRLAW